MSSPDKQWITVAEAVEVAGCTDGYIRRLLREDRLKGWHAGARAWLVHKDAALELRASLSTRSNLRVAERKSLQKKRRSKRS